MCIYIFCSADVLETNEVYFNSVQYAGLTHSFIAMNSSPCTTFLSMLSGDTHFSIIEIESEFSGKIKRFTQPAEMV